MASPQPHPFTRISAEYHRAIAKVRVPPMARQLMDAVMLQTWGYRKKSDTLSCAKIKSITGLSYKQQERAREWLRKANMVEMTQVHNIGITYSIQKDYEQWRVSTTPEKSGVDPRKIGDYPPKNRGALLTTDNYRQQTEDSRGEKNPKSNMDVENITESLVKSMSSPEQKTERPKHGKSKHRGQV